MLAVISFCCAQHLLHNNDIGLGCTTELSALIGYRIVVYTSSAHTQPLGMLAVKYIEQFRFEVGICRYSVGQPGRYSMLISSSK